MDVFIDTSAFFTVLDEVDEDHALALRRLGLNSVRLFRKEVLPQLNTTWVTERQHEIALASLIRSDRRKLSLVDCISFEVMRDSGIQTAFAFGRHFIEEDFDCNIPVPHSH
jgi:predicted nucleic acid-binding protein